MMDFARYEPLGSMANIHFECPKCSQSIDAPGELANQLVDCPGCGETIEVPTRSRIAGSTGAVSPPPPVLERSPSVSAKSVCVYSVVPFVAVIAHGKGSDAAAAQLQQLINEYAGGGWEYVRLESVETYVHGDNGCFGIGATPPRTTVYSMAVFKR